MATYSIKSVPQNIVNSLDEFGVLLGLSRLPGEKNSEYRTRLWDVYIHRGGAHEIGLINGITRELGLLPFETIKLTSINQTTNRPRVIVKDTLIDLYSNWSSIDETLDENILELSIDIYTKTKESYTLAGLVDYINSNSLVFSAELIEGTNGELLSATIFNQDSCVTYDYELLYPQRRNKIQNEKLVPGSVQFSPDGMYVFSTHVDTEADVLSEGDYYIDYMNGVIVSFSVPGINTTCRYMYDNLPLTLLASPVVLHQFGSDNYQDHIFVQVEQEDGSTENSLPTSDGVSMINELLNVVPILWGP